MRGPQYRSPNTIILIMGAPKRVPLILGNPQIVNPKPLDLLLWLGNPRDAFWWARTGSLKKGCPEKEGLQGLGFRVRSLGLGFRVQSLGYSDFAEAPDNMKHSRNFLLGFAEAPGNMKHPRNFLLGLVFPAGPLCRRKFKISASWFLAPTSHVAARSSHYGSFINLAAP